MKQLDEFIAEAQLKSDLAEWRRGRAVRAYINDRKVTDIAKEYGVTRGSVNRWLQWYLLAEAASVAPASAKALARRAGLRGAQVAEAPTHRGQSKTPPAETPASSGAGAAGHSAELPFFEEGYRRFAVLVHVA